MARRRRVAVRHLEVVDVEVGFWCRSCLLGSGVRVWVARSGPEGLALADGYGCSDCGGCDIDPDR